MKRSSGSDSTVRPRRTVPDLRRAARALLLRATSGLLRFLFRLAGGLRVRGLEHIPATGPVIVASNHLSWADPPLLRAVLPRDARFMANDFLFRISVLGPVIRLYGAFPVHRGRLDRAALRQAESYLRQGELVCIFPEGGTTVTGRLVPFEGGVALLALRTGAPIVPAAITGTDRVLPTDPPMIPRYARGGVGIVFGPPLDPRTIDPSLPRREQVERLTRRLYAAVAAMLPPEYLPEVLWSEPAAPVGVPAIDSAERMPGSRG